MLHSGKSQEPALDARLSTDGSLLSEPVNETFSTTISDEDLSITFAPANERDYGGSIMESQRVVQAWDTAPEISVYSQENFFHSELGYVSEAPAPPWPQATTVAETFAKVFPATSSAPDSIKTLRRTGSRRSSSDGNVQDKQRDIFEAAIYN